MNLPILLVLSFLGSQKHAQYNGAASGGFAGFTGPGICCLVPGARYELISTEGGCGSEISFSHEDRHPSIQIIRKFAVWLVAAPSQWNLRSHLKQNLPGNASLGSRGGCLDHLATSWIARAPRDIDTDRQTDRQTDRHTHTHTHTHTHKRARTNILRSQSFLSFFLSFFLFSLSSSSIFLSPLSFSHVHSLHKYLSQRYPPLHTGVNHTKSLQ